MRFNKKMAKTMVFALAFGMLPSVSPVKAAGADKFDNKTGIVKLEDANKFWGIAKPVKKKDKAKANVKINDDYYKVTNIEDYQAGIDAASLGYGKDLIIAYGAALTKNTDGQYENWKVMKIGAADKNFKVVYLGEAGGKIGKIKKSAHALGKESGFLAAEGSDATGKKVVEIDLAADKAKVEVQLGDANWAKLDDFIRKAAAADSVSERLKSLIQKGASIKVRYAKDENTWYKEAKVKVPAQPKAPKVGVDVAKDLLTSLKQGMEYALVAEGANGDPAWTTVPENAKTVEILKIPSIDITKTNSLLVRTKANKGKIVSKIGKTVLKGQTALTVAATNENASEYTLITGTPANDFQNNIKLSLERKFDETSGAILINESNEDYEFFISGGVLADTSLPEKGKWTTLRGMKAATAKPTKVKIKYSKTTKVNTYPGTTKFSILLRKAGKKLKNGEATLASGVKKADVTFKKIEQVVTLAGDNVTNDTGAVAATYKAGEGFEGTFTYKITNYQKFAKKPNLEIAKKDGVKVKVGNFEENGDGSATATITYTLDKKVTTTPLEQKLKLSAEGAAEKEVTITFTKGA